MAWDVLVIPVTWEAEAEGFFEPSNLRPAWVTQREYISYYNNDINNNFKVTDGASIQVVGAKLSKNLSIEKFLR